MKIQLTHFVVQMPSHVVFQFVHGSQPATEFAINAKHLSNDGCVRLTCYGTASIRIVHSNVSCGGCLAILWREIVGHIRHIENGVHCGLDPYDRAESALD